MRLYALIVLVTLALVLGGCKGERQRAEQTQETQTQPLEFEMWSPAFAEGDTIPVKYTCTGEDVSPELHWKGAPKWTKSFALICDDPDAPGKTWVHWVAWGIPGEATSLSEAIPPEPVLDGGMRQGTNDFKRIGYGGPCPPPGKPHRYFFKLYALDTLPDLEPGATKDALLKAINGHILAYAQTIGIYGR